jgi:Tol biopolymer transport system component
MKPGVPGCVVLVVFAWSFVTAAHGQGRVAFSVYLDDARQSDVFVGDMGHDGKIKSVRNATDSAGDDYGPSWSRDGRRLAFLSDRDGSRGLYVMDFDGPEPANVRRVAGGAWGVAGWSPSGRQLVLDHVISCLCLVLLIRLV